MNKALNLSALSKKYGPGYVARLGNTLRVIASARQVDTLFNKVKGRKEFKENKVVITWVPKFGQGYVF